MPNYFVAKPKKINLKEAVTLTVEHLDAQGNGVAYWQSKKVFIQGALAQEKVKAKIIEQKSKFIKAKLVEVITKSADRVMPKCQHYQQCGGCDLQHLARDKQLAFKRQKLTELFARYGIKQTLPWQPTLLGDEWHYRRKARLGVQYNKQGQATIGFRRRGSNQLQPLKRCVVLAKPLDELFPLLNQVVAQLSQSKSIGHIEAIVTQTQLAKPLVTLVIRQLKPLNEYDKKCWLDVAEQAQWQIIIDQGETCYALTPNMPLCYSLPHHLTIEFSHKDFIQVNEVVNEQMITQALHWLALKADDIVLDLFCGLGNFSLPIATQVKQVVGIEGVSDMVKRAKQNAVNNHVTNIEFYQADLNAPWLENTWARKAFTQAILDPARAGAYVAVEQLLQLQIGTILYVSCDPATLAKDSQLLIDAGYKITKIALMDMFTHTKHSETMVLFELH